MTFTLQLPIGNDTVRVRKEVSFLILAINDEMTALTQAQARALASALTKASDELTDKHWIEVRHRDQTTEAVSFATEAGARMALETLVDTPRDQNTAEWAVWKVAADNRKGYRVMATWGVEVPS